MQYQLMFGSCVIDYTLQYRDRKTLGIKVYPDGLVEVLAPSVLDENEIVEKIRQKAQWIKKQIDHFNSYKPTTPIRRFVSGETHLYLGRQYRLKIVPDSVHIVKAYRGQLWMHAIETNRDALKEQLDLWYKQKAALVFNELLEEILPKFSRYKIHKPNLKIRVMSMRWGSCTPSGNIILNTSLIKASKGSILYVIVHELSHVVHPNHGKAFLNLQSKILPDWQKWKERLEYSLV